MVTEEARTWSSKLVPFDIRHDLCHRAFRADPLSFREICFARFPFFSLISFPCVRCLSIVWKRGRPGELNVDGRRNRISYGCFACKWDYPFDRSTIINTQHSIWARLKEWRDAVKNGWLLLGRFSLLLAFLGCMFFLFLCVRWS
jgi:hypothetical protein